jgi:hypothetical protein
MLPRVNANYHAPETLIESISPNLVVATRCNLGNQTAPNATKVQIKRSPAPVEHQDVSILELRESTSEVRFRSQMAV